MIRKLINLWRDKQTLEKTSDLLEKHPALQSRLEIIEDWLESIDKELDTQAEIYEDRLTKLEIDSHPPCPLEQFEGYQPLVDRIKHLEEQHD